MERWKQELDKYIEREPPDDGYDAWFEEVLENVPPDYYDDNSEFFESEEFNKFMNKLWDNPIVSREESVNDMISKCAQLAVNRCESFKNQIEDDDSWMDDQLCH